MPGYFFRPGNHLGRQTCLLLVVGGLIGCSQEPATLDEVIDQNTEATGGRAAIEAVNSIQFDLHIVDPGFSVDGTYRAARPGKMRIDVDSDGKRAFTEAFNGQRAWQWDGNGEPVDGAPAAAAALQHGVELPGKLFGLHEMQQRGHKLDLAGRETIEGVDYYVVRLTFSDGYNTSLYVDPKTWLITRRRDVRPLHPDVDPKPTTIEARYSDFREISGVQFSFSGQDVDLVTGEVLETTTVKSISVNPSFPDKVFDEL
jgi:hypothetical protein